MTDPERTSKSVVLGPVKGSKKSGRTTDARGPSDGRRRGRIAAALTGGAGGVVAVLRRPLVLPIVAAVLAVALAVTAWLNFQQSGEDDARAEALESVPGNVERLLSYSPQNVESSLEAELKLTTGDFRDEYSVLMKETVAPAVNESQLTAAATVVAAGVSEASSDRVDLVLFINVDTSTGASVETTTQGSRVQVIAKKSGGDWKISSLKPM